MLALAGIVGGVLMALLLPAMVLFWRYEIVAAGSDPSVFRLDRWNGEVVLCLPQPPNVLRYRCSGEIDDWVKVPNK